MVAISHLEVKIKTSFYDVILHTLNFVCSMTKLATVNDDMLNVFAVFEISWVT